MFQKINFEQWKEEYFHDKNLMKIFLSLTDSPKSPKRISEDTGFSRSTVYRKIRKLKEKKLVTTSSLLTEDGARTFLYSKTMLGNKIGELGREVIASTVEMALIKTDETLWSEVNYKLKTKYNSSFMDCLDKPEYLKEILLEICGDSYYEILNKIKAEFEKISKSEETESFIKTLSE